MKKLLTFAGIILGMTACNNDNDSGQYDQISFSVLEVFSSTEPNSTAIGEAKVLNSWQELEAFAGKQTADYYRTQSGIDFGKQQVILSKMMYYREPLIDQNLSLKGNQLQYSLKVDKGSNAKPIGVFWTGVVYDQLKSTQLQTNIQVMSNNIAPYGMWSMEKIVDLNTSEMRLPKDGHGTPTNQALYFLELKQSGLIKAKNLANTMNGSFELYQPLTIIDLGKNGLVTTKVLEPALGDGDFYSEKLANSLLYMVEDGKLYLFFDQATKCFIFKRDQ